MAARSTSMVGRRVQDTWNRVEGTVVKWEPLSASANDILVEEDSGRQIWLSSSGWGVRPIDGKGPLPSRDETRSAADAEALRSLRKIRSDLVDEIRTRKPWPGAEHGKVLVGRGINAAIKEIEMKTCVRTDSGKTVCGVRVQSRKHMAGAPGSLLEHGALIQYVRNYRGDDYRRDLNATGRDESKYVKIPEYMQHPKTWNEALYFATELADALTPLTSMTDEMTRRRIGAFREGLKSGIYSRLSAMEDRE